MTNAVSRRAVMAGVASIAAAMPVAAMPVANAVVGFTPNRSAWNAAMDAFRKAEVEADATEAVFMPLHDTVRAEIAALPHKPLPSDPYVGGRGVTTENRAYVDLARRRIEEWDAGKVRLEQHVREDYEQHIAACRKIVGVDDERKAEIAAIEQQHGYREAEERCEALGEVRYEAEWALMELPAPDLPALRWKLEKLLEVHNGSCAGWSEEAIAQTVADMQRLMAGTA